MDLTYTMEEEELHDYLKWISSPSSPRYLCAHPDKNKVQTGMRVVYCGECGCKGYLNAGKVEWKENE